MIISEKQIMQLIKSVQECIVVLDTLNLQSEGYRNKLRTLINEIFKQQSEELKVIECMTQ